MFKKIAIAAALSLIASASFAQAGPASYAGGQINSTKIDGIGGNHTGAGLFVGYQFNENFAIEAGYARLANADITYSGVPVNLKFNQSALSGIATMPLSNGFNVFGRLGYNRVSVKGSGNAGSASDSTSGALYGVGVGYSFTPTIAGRVEYQKASSDSSSAVAAIVFKF